MPTERMEEVEVVCPRHFGTESGLTKQCTLCGEYAGFTGQGKPGIIEATVAPGSLTSARLRLADAAEAWAAKWLAPAACRDQDEWDAMLESAVKLAALRTARGA